MMAETISFLSGVVVVIMSLMVVRAYWSRMSGDRDPAFYLAVAIVAGFISTAIDAGWWQIVVNLYVIMGGDNFYLVREAGLWLDLVMKALAAWAAYMHLKALQKSLSPEEQKGSYWFDMPWHPRKFRVCEALCRRLHK